MQQTAQTILYNGNITTLDAKQPQVSAIAIANGKVLAIGTDHEIRALANHATLLIDLHGKRVIPGLNDSHLHLIRGGLNYNMELRWEGVKSLTDALHLLKLQAERTPAPQWVRVVGGWSEFQFKEKRMPTLAEINAVAPNTPVFILHLYDRALLNGAALRAAGITKDTPDPVAGLIERDANGNPTGMLIAKPNALILYATLASGPKLPLADQVNSTRHFMRELNRLGLTSCIDAGGGFQNYPQDYAVIDQLHKDQQMTIRIAYNLFTQNPGKELNDFQTWTKNVVPYSGDPFYRHNGAGEMLVFSAADFEDFLQPRPDMPVNMEQDLTAVVRHLVSKRWPFRLHATYEETIVRTLNVFEAINTEVTFDGIRWFIDHAETATIPTLERIKKLGGGIAIQHRMAYQGEYFIDRYGAKAAAQAPRIRTMLEMGIPVGGGTDATRVASYNPFISLYWLSTGKTVGGTKMYDDDNILSREEALRIWTAGSAYKSNEETVKGTLSAGMYADLAVLTQDYMNIPEEAIKDLSSVLTIVDGKIVYAVDDYKQYDLSLPPVSPDWAPPAHFDPANLAAVITHTQACSCLNDPWLNPWAFGCGCVAY